VPKVGRNERCSCGSGLKVKRCCGTGAARAAQERAACALGELMTLSVLFPRLRPRGEEFAAWADRVASTQLEEPPLDAALALLDEAERERIESEHAKEYPEFWRSMVDELGNEELARKALVRGAIAAGVWERRPLDPMRLALLDQSSDEEAAEGLALVLDAGDLWSVHESSIADEALVGLDDELTDDAYDLVWKATVAEHARRFCGTWHRARLAELVARVHSRLPLNRFPRATAALEGACDEFERDAALRERLAAMLLADSVCRLAIAPALAA
jgi:SEC-C motif